MAGLPHTVTDLMDPSIIWRAITSTLMEFPLSVSSSVPSFVYPCHFSYFPARSASLLLSMRSLCCGCKMSLMIGSNPQRAPSYLDTFTIHFPPLGCKKHGGSATQECHFLLFFNLDLSPLLLPSLCACVTFLMTPLCAVEWERWGWEDCPFNL